jgi:hypothetical protein
MTWDSVKNSISSVINFVTSRIKSIYLSLESKIKLVDTFVEEVIKSLTDLAKAFLEDLSSNRNRVIFGLAVGVVLLFKFVANPLIGIIAFVALVGLIASWLVYYNHNK